MAYKVITRRLTQHDLDRAVFVKLDSGFMAWGFAHNWLEAEANAASAAMKLQVASEAPHLPIMTSTNI